MIKKLLRLVAVSAVLCGGIVTMQAITTLPADAACLGQGHRYQVDLRTQTSNDVPMNDPAHGPVIAYETARAGTCNGDGTYKGTFAVKPGWRGYLFRGQGTQAPNNYALIAQHGPGTVDVGWQAGTKQSIEVMCAVRIGTRQGYCGSSQVLYRKWRGSEVSTFPQGTDDCRYIEDVSDARGCLSQLFNDQGQRWPGQVHPYLSGPVRVPPWSSFGYDYYGFFLNHGF